MSCPHIIISEYNQTYHSSTFLFLRLTHTLCYFFLVKFVVLFCNQASACWQFVFFSNAKNDKRKKNLKAKNSQVTFSMWSTTMDILSIDWEGIYFFIEFLCVTPQLFPNEPSSNADCPNTFVNIIASFLLALLTRDKWKLFYHCLYSINVILM